MKNLIRIAFMVMLITVAKPSGSSAMSTPSNNVAFSQEQQVATRLEQLRAMDTKSMTREQKREIRHELKSLKRTKDTSSGGVYLSAGAIILIIVLLIIFL